MHFHAHLIHIFTKKNIKLMGPFTFTFTTTSKRFTSAILPTTIPPSPGAASRTPPPRRRQSMRTVGNFTLYLFCGIVTILVLRGTIGINYDDSINESEFNEEAKRIVAQIRSGIEDDDDDDDQPSTDSKSDDDHHHHVVDTTTYSLGPEIKNWDGLRRSWLRRNKDFPSYINGRPRISLLTASSPNPCDYPIGDHYLLKSIKNKMDYCRIHDIDISYNIADIDDELNGLWAKLPLIRKMMISHPETEWIWWMDNDAMFTDMSFEIPILRYDHGSYNMVLHGYPDLLLKEKSWVALNSGSFLLRNCQWSLNLLHAWATMGPKTGGVRTESGKILTANLKGRPVFEADDQSALIYLLISRKDELMEKVFLENSYFLHGFWEGFIDHYEEMMKKYHPGLGDERWPFVTHFVGCKLCEDHDHVVDYPLIDKCLKGMERAFNFADNQVLDLYGFRHKGLLSPNIKRFRNETNKPLENVNSHFTHLNKHHQQ